MTLVEAAARAASRRRALAVLWRFARPHTVLGTWSSIAGIYVIAVAEVPGIGWGDGLDNLLWVLVAGFCVNVAIVGVNQVSDVEIDRVNKPWLPIAAGDLSLPVARRIVAAACVLAGALALSQGAVETAAVGSALAIGFAYSVPPLRLKRFPLVAALSITIVRALVVHLGVFLHFSSALAGRSGLDAVPDAIWGLTAFVLPFSVAIALLKDVPDAEGDRRYAIATFTVRLGPRRVLQAGLTALTLAYAGMAIAGPLWIDGANPVVLAAGHAAAFALLLWWARQADPGNFTPFYMRVWTLFFAEYALVALACVAS